MQSRIARPDPNKIHTQSVIAMSHALHINAQTIHHQSLRLAFAYHLNAASPGVQSGRPYSLLMNFRRLGLVVDELFPLRDLGAKRRTLAKIRNRLIGRNYLLDRDERLLRGFADQLHTALERTPADFLFSPSTLPLSYLETDLPMTFCADAPFCAMAGYYESFSRLSPRQFELAEKLEAGVLHKASLAVYPSEWAAEQAVRHYGVSRDRISVIPFGANLGHANRREDVLQWIEQRIRTKSVRLLFVGSEWKRKRGYLVVKTAAWLRDRGVNAHVDLVCGRVPLPYRALPYVHCHGHLNFQDSEQEAVMAELFKRAHFVFVPSRAEAFGMTFCEANAFGLPALSTATGGISEIIRAGVNGAALSLSAGPEEYGAWIEEAIANPDRYRAFAESSFAEFETRLNWNVHCQTFFERLQKITV